MTNPSDEIQIFHNPRCSKSRASLTLLTEQGVTPKVVEYLNAPPTLDELDHILTLLGLEPTDLMRKHEAPYKENGLDDPSLTREQLMQAMIDYPILIERPIVIKGKRAIIGRPPENVLDLL